MYKPQVPIFKGFGLKKHLGTGAYYRNPNREKINLEYKTQVGRMAGLKIKIRIFLVP